MLEIEKIELEESRKLNKIIENKIAIIDHLKKDLARWSKLDVSPSIQSGLSSLIEHLENEKWSHTYKHWFTNKVVVTHFKGVKRIEKVR